MWMLWLCAALAQDDDDDGGVEVSMETLEPASKPEGQPMATGRAYATLGNRLEADGVGGSVAVGETLVFGTDGGVYATRVVARYGLERLVFAAQVPFATYKTHRGRNSGIGNLQLEAFYRTAGPDAVRLFGLEVHFPTSNAWTWSTDAASLWPGGGVSAVFQQRSTLAEGVDLLVRGSLGLLATRDVAPLPGLFLHGNLSGGVDVALPYTLGVTGELALSYLDPSPIELNGWLRAEPTEGLRTRLGVGLPLGAWAGLTPSGKPAGLREGALMVDVALAF